MRKFSSYGPIDTELHYYAPRQERVYGIELKSFSDIHEYKKSLGQAARYGEELAQKEIFLLFFIESIDEEHRQKYECAHVDEATDVSVRPLFVETGA